jgi:hypothetical protein
MNLKTALWTVAIAAAVAVGYDAYKAKRGG